MKKGLLMEKAIANGRARQPFLPTSGMRPTQDIVDVTPEMAKKWLSQNTANNRKVSKGTVEVYARDMQQGRWLLTHQGVAFNRAGELIDGQHRLHAVILANMTVQMAVARGFEVEYDSPIDQGRGRSASSIMHRSGRWVSMMRTLRHMAKGTLHRHHTRLSIGELQETADAFAEDSLRAYETFGSTMQGGVVAALAFALPVAPDAVTNFGLQVRTGEMLEAGDPALVLRAWISKARGASGADYAYVTCTAIRAAIEGGRIRNLPVAQTNYRWLCGRRRALRIPNTPSADTVPIDRHDRQRDEVDGD